MLALLDHHKVSGEGSIREPAQVMLPAQTLPLSQVAAALGEPVLKLQLKTLGQTQVYQATTPSGVKLLDAATGQAVVVDAARAGALAAAAYAGPEGVASIRKVAAPFTEPAATSSPGATSTGMDSPVTADVSRLDRPSTTTPSVATRSPAPTTR